ncbi:hypothetical protein PVAND_016020 [Polypedilum vanderplanki]|uniref:Uncharacterized protein n=1 Tax=Polypedilum vanderplanki TaxID=319348 RepID=A0A9J6BEN1_POLVA|nr:hypothetical protein PVAND_016020 [Polypedilum vanderplanki]
MKFLMIVFFIIFNVLFTTAEMIQCYYRVEKNYRYIDGNFNECEVRITEYSRNRYATIEGAENANKRFAAGMTNDDIQSLNIDDNYSIKQFPTEVSNVFGKLILIRIRNPNINKLSNEDLKEFPKLKSLRITGAFLKTIEENLFANNPELEVVDFSWNLINQIDPRTFSNLNNLRVLELIKNKCEILNTAETRDEVEELVKEIESGKCQAVQI